ncbi:MAG: hypothetical protein JXR49_04485 [Acidobacteria bacterium]|nr:hypothetical protein [Acidobacteriota bacterium]
MIETDDTGAADFPQIAMDDDGNAIAVWKQFDGSIFHIWAGYFDGATWGTAEIIEIEDNARNTDSPQIAMDDDGNAIAVWSQHDGFRYNIWANYFDGTDWGTAELIETDNSGNAELPQIVMDADGNAVAVWEQRDGTRNIRANYFDGATWGTAVTIETDDTGNAYSPQIDMDGEGNAIAVWSQFDGFNYNIWANYFDGTAWGTAEIIDTNNVGSAYSPQIAMNHDGNAVSVWEQHDSFRYNIWANNFILYDEDEEEVAEWGMGMSIEDENTGDAESPQIAMDDDGNAIAVWMQFDGFRYNIWANHFDGTAWGMAELIETVDYGNAYSPQIAMGDDGNAIAVWTQYDGFRYNIWVNHFDGTTWWGIAELIETVDTGNAESPQIAMDDDGNAIAVWTQFDGSQFSIYANRFE